MFNKLARFQIRCSICNRQTDCMAPSADFAAQAFAVRGWRVTRPDAEGAVGKHIICNRCLRRLKYQRPAQDQPDQPEKGDNHA